MESQNRPDVSGVYSNGVRYLIYIVDDTANEFELRALAFDKFMYIRRFKASDFKTNDTYLTYKMLVKSMFDSKHITAESDNYHTALNVIIRNSSHVKPLRFKLFLEDRIGYNLDQLSKEYDTLRAKSISN